MPVAGPVAPPPLAEIPAAQLTVAEIGVLPPLGGRYSGLLPMLAKDIPLPSGAWRVVAQQKSAFAGYPPGATVILVRSQGRRLTGVLEITGNAASHPAPAGWPLNPVCQAAQSPDAAVLGGDARAAMPGGVQDCIAVTSQASAAWTVAEAAPRLHALTRSLARLGIKPPPTLLLVAFGQTDAHVRLAETLWLPVAGADHRQQDVDHILDWAQGWRGVVRQALVPGAIAAAASVAEIR